MWQLPMALISTRLKGARGISSLTRVLTARLPCEDLRPIVWGDMGLSCDIAVAVRASFPEELDIYSRHLNRRLSHVLQIAI